MKLKHIYDIFMREGIRADPRKPEQIRKALQAKRREYRQRQAASRKFFDSERFRNPYADLRIVNGNPQRDVRRMLVGIDIDVGELVMADRMAQKGEGFDLVLAHHPKGIALARLGDVMRLQTDLLVNLGIQESIANDLMGKRIQEVARSLHSANHARVVDAAQLLDIPLMCCPTHADHHVVRYLQKLMDSQKPKTLEQIVRLLMQEPEYRHASALQAGP